MEGSNFKPGTTFGALHTNKVNKVLQSLMEIEKNVQQHKESVMCLKTAIASDDGSVSDTTGTRMDPSRGNSRSTTHQANTASSNIAKDYYTPQLAEHVNHPSKHAVSSLVLGENFRREYDCAFNAILTHNVPLIDRKSIWIGGYTSRTRPCPYLDMDSGVYTCSLQRLYFFDVKLTFCGEKVCMKMYLCRGRDGLREVMKMPNNEVQGPMFNTQYCQSIGAHHPSLVQGMTGSAPGGVYHTPASFENSFQYGRGQVQWRCEIGDQVWLEVMAESDSGSETILCDVVFSGSLCGPNSDEVELPVN